MPDVKCPWVVTVKWTNLSEDKVFLCDVLPMAELGAQASGKDVLEIASDEQFVRSLVAETLNAGFKGVKAFSVKKVEGLLRVVQDDPPPFNRIKADPPWDGGYS